MLGIAAVALWLLAAGLFFRAAALGYAPGDPDVIEGDDATERFVQHVLDTAKEERRKIDHWINVAGLVAILPLALTLVTLGIAVLHEPARETERAAVRLDDASRGALSQLCGRRMPAVVRGRVDVAGRGDGTLELLLAAGRCRRSKPVEVALPEDELLVLVGR
ncbi:MAG TPA: hypothetical protein VMY78_10945 [Solirubrobacteraceae bacterium]|nr:hypothetical protein [Solirubrobacteraceae bacterium]